jgi:hypothetical protein
MRVYTPSSKAIWIPVCLIVFSALSSCLKSSNNIQQNTQPAAYITVLQASPDEPPVDFYYGGEKINQNSLSFGQGLSYFGVASGQQGVYFYAPSLNSPLLAGDTLTFAASTYYSIFLDNTTAKPGILALIDTLKTPASGTAGVRVIDLSPDAPAVNLVIQGGSTIASNLTFREHTSFLSVTGGTYTLNIVSASSGTALATLPKVSLSAGYLYSIVLEGLYNSTNSSDKLAIGVTVNAVP